MWNVKPNVLVLCFFIFVFCPSLSFSSQMGMQYVSENTYRNTLGPLFLFSPLDSPKLQLELGTGLLVSDKDWESVSYRAQLEIPLLTWFSLGFRGAHRFQIPETFSRTTFLGFVQVDSPRLGPIAFRFLGGWYKRFAFLERASVIPFAGSLNFSQHDFALDIGLISYLTQNIHWQVKVATFDELEVYNLNHPFVESAFFWVNPETQGTWAATFRYQLSLGFGRLDRLSFGLSYTTPQSLL